MRRAQLGLFIALASGLSVSSLAQTTAAPSVHPKPRQLAPDSLERARKFTGWLYTNQTDSLFAYMDSASQKDMKTPKALEQMVAELATRAGSEEQLIEERW